MHAIALIGMLLSSILSPVKTWSAPDAPLQVAVKTEGDARVVLTKFGAAAELGSKDVSGEATLDLKQLFPQVKETGCYVVYLVPKGKPLAEFSGTPLVVNVREDKHNAGSPMVTKIEPLRYVLMTTKQGPVKLAFYYDVAPNTVNSFLTLSEQGYFDGLLFHRIIKNFVIQGGDPKGDGSGGPGYNLEAEFNDRLHTEGVLSMARASEPNSAGSQFFICLDYGHTKSLDHQYTAFGKVTDGMNAVKEIGAVATDKNDRPIEKQAIEKMEVKPVTASDNPYAALTK